MCQGMYQGLSVPIVIPNLIQLTLLTLYFFSFQVSLTVPLKDMLCFSTKNRIFIFIYLRLLKVG